MGKIGKSLTGIPLSRYFESGQGVWILPGVKAEIFETEPAGSRLSLFPETLENGGNG